MTIEIKRFPGVDPAIGYTDYSAVYLSEVLHGTQYALVLKHELGHIWLQHGPRTRARQPEDARLWNVACDMEIARHLYSDEDDLVITSPRSWLSGGIRKSDADKFPDCDYAEEFYEALLLQPEEHRQDYQSHDGDANGQSSEGSPHGDANGQSSEGSPHESAPLESTETLVDKAKALLEEHGRAAACVKMQEALKGFRPPSSLASELDQWLVSPSLQRERSYRRPSRRTTGDLFRKGEVVVPKQPLITIYIDRSGSFDDSKTEAATQALDRVLMKYRASVKTDVWYFNNGLLDVDPKVGGGGTNYGAVVEHINSVRPKIAVMVTDDDPCDPTLKIEGNTNLLIICIGTPTTCVGKVLSAKEIVLSV